MPNTTGPNPAATSPVCTRPEAIVGARGPQERPDNTPAVKAADPAAEAARAAARLSKRQKALLLDLAVLHDRANCPGLWGRIPFRWFRPRNQGRTRSDSAAFSRALRELEARGLILRVNTLTGGFYDGSWDRVRTRADQAPPRRSNCIELTPLGLRVAAKLLTLVPRPMSPGA